MAMHNLGRGIAALESKRISTCKICRLGIFEGQPYRWSTGRVLGLIHDECAEAPDVNNGDEGADSTGVVGRVRRVEA